MKVLRHNQVDLAVHELEGGEGRPLLLLHGLGERSPDATPADVTWPGPVLALDFTGHGASSTAAVARRRKSSALAKNSGES